MKKNPETRSLFKRVILTLLVFFCVESLLAQTMHTTAFDSLVIVCNKYTKQDEVKLNMLNRVAIGYQGIDPAKGIETSNKAIELSLKLKHDIGYATALNTKAGHLSSQAKYKEADSLVHIALQVNSRIHNKPGMADNYLVIGYLLPVKNKTQRLASFRQSLQLSEEAGYTLGKCEAYFYIGTVYHAHYEFPEALKNYEIALQIAEAINNQTKQAKILMVMGEVYANLSDFKRALEAEQRSLKLYENLGNKLGMAKNLGNIFNIYKYNGEYDKAIVTIQKAIELNREINEKWGTANNLLQLGQLFSELADYPKALTYINQALKMYQELNNKIGIAQAYGASGAVYLQQGNYGTAIEYYQKAAILNDQLNRKRNLANNYSGMSIIYAQLENYEKALEFAEKSYKIEEQIGNKDGMASDLDHMGTMYGALNEYDRSLSCFHKALEINKEIDNDAGVKNNLHNIGDTYYRLKDYPKALDYYTQSLEIKTPKDEKSLRAYSLGGLGRLYPKLPDTSLVRIGIRPADKYRKGIETLEESIRLAKEIEDRELQMDCWKSISELNEEQKNYPKAYEAYQNYVSLRDSIGGEKVKEKITRSELQYEYAHKEDSMKYTQQLLNEQLKTQQVLNQQQEQNLVLSSKELEIKKKENELQHMAYLKEQSERQEKEQQLTLSVKNNDLKEALLNNMKAKTNLQQAELIKRQQELELRNNQRNFFMAGAILMFLLAGSIFMGLNRTMKARKLSEDLLHNILPQEIAKELKEHGFSEARQFEQVTVLFTDFVGFTKIAEQMSPKDLVSEIHKHFQAFDAIIKRNGLEKIKTIGDAYLAVCGLPVENELHALRVTQAAIEIRDYINSLPESLFHIRIGVHSGPVVAGIVGMIKYSYDIWGDTVNTAARMEQNCEPGKINISGQTYELIRDHFNVEFRGKIAAKNKGDLEMYYLL